MICGSKYEINLNHPILTDHGIFYPRALYEDLKFEVTLAPASQVVKGSDPTKLKYKLTNIELKYEKIQTNYLADEARSVYTTGTKSVCDSVIHDKSVTINKDVDKTINIKVDPKV